MSETNRPATEIETENASEIPADTEPEASEETEPEKSIPSRNSITGDCPSISGRSTLTYAIGRHKETGELHLRIVDNSGKGMWFAGWASAKDIDAIVKGQVELTAKSFHALHPGKSINTGGFVLAVLKDLGLIRAGTGQHSPPRARPCNHVARKWPWCAWAKPLKPPAKPAKRKGKGA